MVTCEIKHQNNFEIVSMFYFTCNHHISDIWEPWPECLSVKYNAKIISK